MQAFDITETKFFMAKLLTDATFDTFLVSSASVTTFATFQIDGKLHPDYFDSDDDAAVSSDYCTWKVIRPHVMNLIRGKHKPLGFHIVLRLASYNVESMLTRSGLPLKPEDVAGLFLTIHYEADKVRIITGSSLNVFTLDRTLDQVWDDMVGKLLHREKIAYTQE